jgi:hypothetical protein
VSWTVQYWYLVAFFGLILVLTFGFLYETGYTRHEGESYPVQPTGFFANRIATLFGSRKAVPHKTWGQAVSTFPSIFPAQALANSWLTRH